MEDKQLFPAGAHECSGIQRERRRERADRQQDCDESDEEPRLLNITQPLVHASETTAATTRPRKSQKRVHGNPCLTCVCPREDSSVPAPVCPGRTHGLVQDRHVLV